MKKLAILLTFFAFLVPLSSQTKGSYEIKAGDFSLSSGVVYGQMGWENVKDIKTDGNYVYILVSNSPNHYLLKYSSNTNNEIVVSTVSISDKYFEDYYILLLSSSNIYIVGQGYSGALSGTSYISVLKYTTNLIFISSNTFNANSGETLYVKSAEIDDENIYACVQSVSSQGEQAFLATVNTQDLSSGQPYQISNYFCHEQMIKAGSNIYAILHGNATDFYALDVKNTGSTPVQFGGNFSWQTAFGSNSSNVFAVSWIEPNKIAVYKYPSSNFSSFISSTTLPISGTPSFGIANDYGLLFAYSVFNNLNQVNDYYITVIDTQTLKLRNTFTANVSENSYPKRMAVYGNTAYLTGETYLCKTWGCDNDIRTVRFSNFDLTENKKPVLTFPSGYQSNKGLAGGNILLSKQPATFYVEYYDLDGDATQYMRIGIKKANDTDFTYYDMNCVEGCGNFSNKVLFAYTTTFAETGAYSYKFDAADNHGNGAEGYPVNTFYFNVIEGFLGSFGSGDKKVNISIPVKGEEKRQYKILTKGDAVYALFNPNTASYEEDGSMVTHRMDAPSFIVKLSTSTNDKNRFYDFNMNFPYMTNPMGWFIYDADFDENGDMQVIAASQTQGGYYDLFFATVSPTVSGDLFTFNVINSSSIIGNLSKTQLPKDLKIVLKYGKRIGFGEGGIVACDNECRFNEIDGANIVSADLDQSGNIYFAGYISTTALFGRIDTSNISTFTFIGPGNTIEGRFNSIFVKGNYIYLLGTFKTPADNYGMILKLDKGFSLVDSKIMNPGKRESFDFIKDAGDFIVVSGNINKDDTLTAYVPFIIVLSSNTLDYVNLFKDGSESNLMDINVVGNKVYYVKESIGSLPLASGEKTLVSNAEFIKVDDIVDNRVSVTVNLKNTLGNSLANTKIDFIPFEEERVDAGKSVIGLKTDDSGWVTVKLLKGIPYFIAVSSHGYSPNIRQQMFDPYKRFIKVFSSNSNISYNTFSLSKENLSKYSVVVQNLVKGMEVFGSITYNNEPVSFAAAKASDSVITLDFYNLPQIEPNKYKLEISIPELLNYTTVISTTDVLLVDFSSATPPGYSYEEAKIMQPVLKGIVVDSSNGNPVFGATVMISTYNCYSWSKTPVATLNTDPAGSFSLYPENIPPGVSIICVDIKKQGYIPLTQSVTLSTDFEKTFSLTPATYSISGYLTYKGRPLGGFKIEAGGYHKYEFNFKGTDSYCKPDTDGKCTEGPSWVSASAVTDARGYFNITGLKDGNIALYNTGSFWRNINSGADNSPGTSDDIRIVISSAGAIPPSLPPNNICTPGKVWILNSEGMCIGIAPYTFDIAETLTENATLYLNVKYDVVNATDTSATILIEEECKEGKDCSKLKHIMISLPDNLTSGTTSYVVNLTSGTKYSLKILSDKWAKRSIFDDFDFTSTDTIKADIVLTKAGSLRIKVVKPDGSFFIPVCNTEGCRWPRFYITNDDKTFNYSSDFWVDANDPNPVFEIPNIVPGRYTITFKAEGYPVASMKDINVEAGKVCEVKLKMRSGLVVKPNITSLPQTEYNYAVLAMPQGFEMKRNNINDLLFSEGSGERYVVDYDPAASSFKQKYLDEGTYDVYLVLASRYSPDDEEHPSLRSFVNFIGVEKGKNIQRNTQDPTYGTEANPVSDFNIYGSLGKATITGKIKGNRIITDKDFEKIFSGNLGHLISLIPSVMLYDEAGNLRAYSHCLMDSAQAFNSFIEAVQITKDTQSIVSIFNSSSSYFVPSLPTGKYTAVFLSPNYPPVSKEIVLNSTYTVFDIDFDKETYSKTKLTVNVIEDINGSTAPSKGARISISHKAYEKVVYTDDNGGYVFENIPIGLYRMEVFKDGYAVEGKKFSLGNEELSYNIVLKPSQKIIRGKVYLSKFPRTLVSGGVEVTAYNESKLIQGANYVPSIKVLTGDDGSYEIKGVEKGATYRIVARYPGKLTQAVNVIVSETETYTYADDIVFMDIPPQIDVKVKRYKNTLEIYVKSPKEISGVPVCEYLRGKYTLDNFDETNATRLSLIALPNNTYAGRFNISTLADYYTIRVRAGDIDVIEKAIVYDVKNDISAENYITDQIYVGGSIYADAENEDYTGIELDPGSLTHSTSALTISSQLYGKMIKVLGVGDSGLIGGFFSALPTVRTTRTSKGEMTLSDAIKSIMASDVYDINLSNVQPNKEFTLTLKYDKEKVLGNTSSLRIYQYDESTAQWKEVKGTYTVDPMLGTVSVDVASISNAYESSSQNLLNPYVRKRFGMSAISGGRFVPCATTTSQSGRFAVFVAKPPTGTSYSGSSFEVYNIPNPFNLKSKVVTISADGGSWHTGDYTTEGTIIKYHLPAGKSGNVKFVIYNIAGEKVRTLDEGHRDGGYIYYSEWDGRNDKNEKVASGVYFLVTYLNGDKVGGIHKMAVIK